jgi:hypothetical protein
VEVSSQFDKCRDVKRTFQQCGFHIIEHLLVGGLKKGASEGNNIIQWVVVKDYKVTY